MTYTIQLNLGIDQEEIIGQEDMSRILKDLLGTSTIDVSDVRIIEIND